MNPTVVASLMLKINVMLFFITAGLSALTFFPYQLHLNQLANNVAIDVANRNYTVRDDVLALVGHLNADAGESAANTFSLLTFKESNISGQVKGSEVDRSSVSSTMKGGGITAYADKLEYDSNSLLLKNGGSNTVSVNVDVLSGPESGKSLIVNYRGGDEFDPLNDNTHLVDGMTGTNMAGNSTLVNRGTTFDVRLKSRFNLAVGGFGYRLNFAIPVEGVSVGVTTQYYQYD